MIRRAVAAGGALVAIVLLVLLVKGCRDSAREQAFRDYFTDAGALIEQSNQESSALFTLLGEPGSDSAVDLGQSVNSYRGEAAQLVDRAQSLDTPDELRGPHDHFVEVLKLRRDGIAGIAEELPTALGDAEQEDATAQIAVWMRNFLASDVLYTERVVPGWRNAAEGQELEQDVAIPKSHFITDLGWLSATTVAERITAIREGGGGDAAAPGLHGTGLGTVTVKPGEQALTEGGAVEIEASPNLSFDVQVMNQGEHEETEVPVKVSVTGAGDPIVVEQTLDTIAAGQSKTVSVPLAAAPPTGRPVTIEVEILPVPGEENSDNNSQSFAAVFTE